MGAGVLKKWRVLVELNGKVGCFAGEPNVDDALIVVENVV